MSKLNDIKVLRDINDKGPAQIEMTITPVIEAMMRGAPLFLEIEMLQGHCEPRPGGMIYYRFEVNDPDKKEILREFMLRLYQSIGGMPEPSNN